MFVDDDKKLTLHGLRQFYIRLQEEEKNRKLTDLLDALEFNQVVIFVSKVQRANELNRLLCDCNFPSICIHSRMKQEDRFIPHHFQTKQRNDLNFTLFLELQGTSHLRTSTSEFWWPLTCLGGGSTLRG